MILYHPYRDANHCSYRILSILMLTDEKISLEQLKLFDFYYLFPQFLRKISPWPSEISSLKKHLRELEDGFENTPNIKKLFFDLDAIQNRSVFHLAAKGLISIEELRDKIVLVNQSKIPVELKCSIDNDLFNQSKIMDIICHGLVKAKWQGPKGLKKRSGLMEYLYDE